MNSCFIILAGGESKRFNSNIPKPYTNYNGKPLLLHSIDKAKIFNKYKKIVLVINKKHKDYIKNLNIKNIIIINIFFLIKSIIVNKIMCYMFLSWIVAL